MVFASYNVIEKLRETDRQYRVQQARLKSEAKTKKPKKRKWFRKNKE